VVGEEEGGGGGGRTVLVVVVIGGRNRTCVLVSMRRAGGARRAAEGGASARACVHVERGGWLVLPAGCARPAGLSIIIIGVQAPRRIPQSLGTPGRRSTLFRLPEARARPGKRDDSRSRMSTQSRLSRAEGIPDGAGGGLFSLSLLGVSRVR